LRVATTASPATGSAAPFQTCRGSTQERAALVDVLVPTHTSPGIAAIVAEQQLSERAADERTTRIRTLIERVLPEDVD